jgi:hypothetical protein
VNIECQVFDQDRLINQEASPTLGFEVAKISAIEPYIIGIDRPDTHIVITQTGDLPTSAESMAEMLKTEFTAFLNLSIQGGDEYSVPVKYSYYIKPFLVMKSQDGDESNENNILKSISFGEQNMDMGSTMTIYIKNPNNFAVVLSSVLDDPNFGLEEFDSRLEGQEIQVMLNPFKPVDENVEVPKSKSFKGVLEFHTDVAELGSASFALSGTLVDVSKT